MPLPKRSSLVTRRPLETTAAPQPKQYAYGTSVPARRMNPTCTPRAKALPAKAKTWCSLVIRTAQRTFLIATTGLLIGCALQAKHAPISAPPAPAPELPDLSPWWKGFDDPLLNDLMERALSVNNRVEAAQAALRQARAQRQITQAGTRPSVTLGAAARLGQSGASSLQNVSTNIDARWESDWLGRQDMTIAAATAETRAAEASLRDVQVSVTAEVALAYIQLRAAQAQANMAQEALRHQQELLQLTRWKAQAGLASAADVQQGEAALAQAQAQPPQLVFTQKQSANALAILTNRQPGTLTTLIETPAPIPTLVKAPPATIDASRLRQRPDVRIADWRTQAARARLGEAQARQYPSFSLSGSISLSGLNLADMLAGSLARSVLGAWSVPLLDGGLGAARVQSQEIALEQARIDMQSTVQRALQDIDDAGNSLRQNQERIEYLKAASDSAAQSSDTAHQRYRAGLVDFQVVLQAQRAAQSTTESLINARANLSADYVRLIKALGGAWAAQS